jgi:Flp pilus assembly pilin Flp
MSILDQFIRLTARRLASVERGQALAEYALVLSFIALIVIAVLLLFGPGVSGLYQSFFDEMP